MIISWHIAVLGTESTVPLANKVKLLCILIIYKGYFSFKLNISFNILN